MHLWVLVFPVDHRTPKNVDQTKVAALLNHVHDSNSGVEVAISIGVWRKAVIILFNYEIVQN